MFRPSELTSVCSWKGTARYYDVGVNGKTNRNAAWYYPDREPAASVIKARVAFWKGVKIRKEDELEAAIMPKRDGVIAVQPEFT